MQTAAQYRKARKREADRKAKRAAIRAALLGE